MHTLPVHHRDSLNLLPLSAASAGYLLCVKAIHQQLLRGRRGGAVGHSGEPFSRHGICVQRLRHRTSTRPQPDGLQAQAVSIFHTPALRCRARCLTR